MGASWWWLEEGASSHRLHPEAFPQSRPPTTLVSSHASQPFLGPSLWGARTVPGIEHVGDEVVDEGDLGLGHAARLPVEHRHHHRQLPLLLLLCLWVQAGARVSPCPDPRPHVPRCSEYLSGMMRQLGLTWGGQRGPSIWPEQPHLTCAKYSSEMRAAHSTHSSRARQGLDTSAHLTSMRLTRARLSGALSMASTAPGSASGP